MKNMTVVAIMHTTTSVLLFGYGLREPVIPEFVFFLGWAMSVVLAWMLRDSFQMCDEFCDLNKRIMADSKMLAEQNARLIADQLANLKKFENILDDRRTN